MSSPFPLRSSSTTQSHSLQPRQRCARRRLLASSLHSTFMRPFPPSNFPDLHTAFLVLVRPVSQWHASAAVSRFQNDHRLLPRPGIIRDATSAPVHIDGVTQWRCFRDCGSALRRCRRRFARLDVCAWKLCCCTPPTLPVLRIAKGLQLAPHSSSRVSVPLEVHLQCPWLRCASPESPAPHPIVPPPITHAFPARCPRRVNPPFSRFPLLVGVL